MMSFVDDISTEDKGLINRLRQVILAQDKVVTETSGQIMRAKDALLYNEDGVMKYGLARTATGFTFHSMVMYANGDVFDFAKANLTGVKFQKGCLNISSLEGFDLAAFEKMLRLSATKDFSPVIAHYKKKARG